MNEPSANSAFIGLEIFLYLAVLSLMAIGGGVTTVTPEIQRYFVTTNHWLTEQQFLDSYTLAQIAPGPNVLFVTLIGYQAAGMMGAVAATLAMLTPSTLITLSTLRWGQQLTTHPRINRFWQFLRNAFSPLSVGLVAATSWLFSQTALSSTHNHTAAIALLVTCVFLLFKTRIHVLWLFAFGAACGVLGWV